MKEKRYTITLRKNIVKFQTNIQTTYSSLIFVRPREFLALYFQQWQRSLFDRLLVVWQLQLGLDELFFTMIFGTGFNIKTRFNNSCVSFLFTIKLTFDLPLHNGNSKFSNPSLLLSTVKNKQPSVTLVISLRILGQPRIL